MDFLKRKVVFNGITFIFLVNKKRSNTEAFSNAPSPNIYSFVTLMF